jgi:hypothetical protein
MNQLKIALIDGGKSAHPEVVEMIKKQLTRLCEAGAPLNLIAVRAIIIATIHKMAPEVFEKRYADGSYLTRTATRSYISLWDGQSTKQ